MERSAPGHFAKNASPLGVEGDPPLADQGSLGAGTTDQAAITLRDHRQRPMSETDVGESRRQARGRERGQSVTAVWGPGHCAGLPRTATAVSRRRACSPGPSECLPGDPPSGRGDSNPRPPAPKAGALPLRHSPASRRRASRRDDLYATAGADGRRTRRTRTSLSIRVSIRGVPPSCDELAGHDPAAVRPGARSPKRPGSAR